MSELIAKGADARPRSQPRGWNPLMNGPNRFCESFKFAELLLRYGAEVDARTNWGKIARSY